MAIADWPWLRSAAWVVTAFLAMVVLSRVALPKPVAFPVLLHGVVIGSINALLAIGIVLVYRSNRIINFAHAEIGVFGGILFENLARKWDVPWVVALAAGVLAAAALGGLLEVLVLRRFARSPRLITTVATIGIGQLVVVCTWLLASGFGSYAAVAGVDTPFSGFDLTIGQVVFSGDALLLVALVPAVVIAIELLLRRTAFGVAVRASAESSERAALMGVPVKTVGTVTWVVASGLAGLAAILHAPVVGLLSGGTAQGPTFLLRALTAAVIGRMENLRVAVVAALFLGVIDQALYIAYDGSTVADVVFVVLAICALLLQRRSTGRARDDATTWVATEEIRPIPARLRRLPEVRIGRVLTLGAVALTLAVIAGMLSPGDANRASTIAIYCLVAVSLVVLTGWAGQISLGQFGIVGIGAGVTARLLADAHWDFFVALGVGALVGAAAAMALGLVALRLKGFFFAVTSLGFAVAVQTYFLNGQFFNGLTPTNRPERPVLFGRFDLEGETSFFVFSLVVLAAVSFVVFRLRQTRTGRTLIAVRDNDTAAASYAVSPVRAKLLAFALSGAIAGIAGGLLAVQQHTVAAEAYSPNESLRVFSMVVIGGAGSITGALLGGIYVRGASLYLSNYWAILASGAGMLAVLLVLPGGLGRLVFRVRDEVLRRIAKRRGIDVPSLQRAAAIEPEPPAPTPTPVDDRVPVGAVH